MSNQNDDIAYNEEHDTYYSLVTGEWIEDPCDDPTCEYCVNRPAKPLFTPLVKNDDSNIQ
jgi:hypothetical protein